MPYIREVWTPLRLFYIRLYVDAEHRWYRQIRNGRITRIRWIRPGTS